MAAVSSVQNIHFFKTNHLRASAPPKSEALSEKQMARLTAFFKGGRTYEYRSDIRLGIDNLQLNLQFTFSTINLLRSIVLQMKNEGIIVQKILLKGGAVDRILTGRPKPLVDIDFTIHLKEDPATFFWQTVEKAFLNALAIEGKIDCFSYPTKKNRHLLTVMQSDAKLLQAHVAKDAAMSFTAGSIFGHQGRNARALVDGKKGRFAIQSIPTFFENERQDIDFQFLLDSSNSCFTSQDALQFDLTPLVFETGSPMLCAVDDYDLDHCLALRAKRQFYVKEEKIDTLLEGLRGYCRCITLGWYPESFGIERQFWRQFIREYREKQSGFASLRKAFDECIEKHYSNDPQGRLFYFLNFHAIFLRSAETTSLTMNEWNELEEIVLDYLYATAGCVRGEDPLTDIQLTHAYFFLCSPNPRSIANGFSETLFLAGDDALLLPALRRNLYQEKELHAFPLLQVVNKQENLSSFLGAGLAKVQKKPHPIGMQIAIPMRPLWLNFLQQSETLDLLKIDQDLSALIVHPSAFKQLHSHHIEVCYERAVELTRRLLKEEEKEGPELANRLLQWAIDQPAFVIPGETLVLELFSHLAERNLDFAYSRFEQILSKESIEGLPFLKALYLTGQSDKYFDFLLRLSRKGSLHWDKYGKELQAQLQRCPKLPQVMEIIKNASSEFQKNWISFLFEEPDLLPQVEGVCSMLYRPSNPFPFMQHSGALDVPLLLFYLREAAKSAALDVYTGLQKEIFASPEFPTIFCAFVNTLPAKYKKKFDLPLAESLYKLQEIDSFSEEILQALDRLQEGIGDLQTATLAFLSLEDKVQSALLVQRMKELKLLQSSPPPQEKKEEPKVEPALVCDEKPIQFKSFKDFQQFFITLADSNREFPTDIKLMIHITAMLMKDQKHLLKHIQWVHERCLLLARQSPLPRTNLYKFHLQILAIAAADESEKLLREELIPLMIKAMEHRELRGEDLVALSALFGDRFSSPSAKFSQVPKDLSLLSDLFPPSFIYSCYRSLFEHSLQRFRRSPKEGKLLGQVLQCMEFSHLYLNAIEPSSSQLRLHFFDLSRLGELLADKNVLSESNLDKMLSSKYAQYYTELLDKIDLSEDPDEFIGPLNRAQKIFVLSSRSDVIVKMDQFRNAIFGKKFQHFIEQAREDAKGIKQTSVELFHLANEQENPTKSFYFYHLALFSVQDDKFLKVNILGGISKCYTHLKLYFCALESIEQALSIDPENIDFQFIQISSYYYSWHKEKAFQKCNELLAAHPNQLIILQFCIQLYTTEINSLKSASSDPVLSNIFSEIKRLSRIQQELLRQCVQLEPTTASYLLYLGSSHQNMHEYREAILHLQKATMLDSDDCQAHFCLGQCYMALEERENAHRAFSAAITLWHKKNGPKVVGEEIEKLYWIQTVNLLKTRYSHLVADKYERFIEEGIVLPQPHSLENYATALFKRGVYSFQHAKTVEDCQRAKGDFVKILTLTPDVQEVWPFLKEVDQKIKTLKKVDAGKTMFIFVK